MNELLTAEKWATKVNYLLEKDHLINDPDNYSGGRWHFWAPEILYVIFLKYYKGDKMRDAKDPDFVDGTYSRMMDTWKKRSVQNQVGTLEVIRETIEEKVNIPMQLHMVLNKEDDEALAVDIMAWRAAKAHRKAQGDRATVEHSNVDNIGVSLWLVDRVEGLSEAVDITPMPSEA
ncbi:uncharacterized protein H6S33_013178 [Morchella sextelata]|uniref:uncharacterized protein n=1 Tax=Morchella sextelata TaxID=1174677 RepID=UPI001D0524BB|nr:uncharacterized protein H6S33_013178 [Morchella sextelata]KAH0609692.1 hypothetical protein H6S33_013178 [Morchella sextelata]